MRQKRSDFVLSWISSPDRAVPWVKVPTKLGRVVVLQSHHTIRPFDLRGLVMIHWVEAENLIPSEVYMGATPKMVVFLLKMISTWGVERGETHHLRKHPYENQVLSVFFRCLQVRLLALYQWLSLPQSTKRTKCSQWSRNKLVENHQRY